MNVALGLVAGGHRTGDGWWVRRLYLGQAMRWSGRPGRNASMWRIVEALALLLSELLNDVPNEARAALRDRPPPAD